MKRVIISVSHTTCDVRTTSIPHFPQDPISLRSDKDSEYLSKNRTKPLPDEHIEDNSLLIQNYYFPQDDYDPSLEDEKKYEASNKTLLHLIFTEMNY